MFYGAKARDIKWLQKLGRMGRHTYSMYAIGNKIIERGLHHSVGTVPVKYMHSPFPILWQLPNKKFYVLKKTQVVKIAFGSHNVLGSWWAHGQCIFLSDFSLHSKHCVCSPAITTNTNHSREAGVICTFFSIGWCSFNFQNHMLFTIHFSDLVNSCFI